MLQPALARLQREAAIADSFGEVTVLFADVVGFTRLAAAYPADNVVRLLNRILTAFDEIGERWEVEKIKTIGDAYMIASGLPLMRQDHAHVVAEVALAMRAAVARIGREQGLVLELRIGIRAARPGSRSRRHPPSRRAWRRRSCPT